MLGVRSAMEWMRVGKQQQHEGRAVRWRVEEAVATQW